MNGKVINTTIIRQLLELANWAPTHGTTEPWRFNVYEKAAKQQFCEDHAALYKKHTPEEKFTSAKYEKIRHQGDMVSHIVLVYMKRSAGKSIPVQEEYAAVCAAIQNILLGAASLGIAVLWSTGGMTHHPAMKDYLGLEAEDQLAGIVYMGYTDLPVKEGKRNTPVTEKTLWKG